MDEYLRRGSTNQITARVAMETDYETSHLLFLQVTNVAKVGLGQYCENISRFLRYRDNGANENSEKSPGTVAWDRLI